nr:VIN3-like protein 2 [Ipomoea batatas]
MGKERKYTGLTKLRIIENLLKIVAEKKSLENGSSSNLELPSSEKGQRSSKRQRKADHPNHFPTATSNVSTTNPNSDLGNVIYCKNLACRARLNSEDAFCKRCSCCICRNYDDNKDPSLWLVCNSEPPFQRDSCGMSCHLECAIRHERSGIVKDRQDEGINGSFYCVSCGKANDLLSSLRKQLVTARDTRRVDILCYRISLSQKILGEAKSCNKLYTVMDEAVKKLEEEVGPLTGSPVKTARGIVNRLSSGPEVQRLCGLAVEYLDSMLSERVLEVPSDPKLQDCNVIASKLIRFEDVCASSVTIILSPEESTVGNFVGYTLWHRKVDDLEYPVNHTCTLFAPNTRFLLSGLVPATEYLLRVVSLDSQSKGGVCELRFETSNEASHLNSENLEVERSQSVRTNCSSPSSNRPSVEEDEINDDMPSYSNEDEDRGDNSLSCYTDNITSTNLSPKAATTTVKNIIPSLGGEEQMMRNFSSSTRLTDVIDVENKDSPDAQIAEETSTGNGSNTPPETILEHAPYSAGNLEAGGLPITPYKTESMDFLGRKGRFQPSGKDGENGYGKEDTRGGSSSKKRSIERFDKQCGVMGGDKDDFEYYVKVIRWLECSGHIEMEFRQKFLTWYSLRANPQEVRVVKAFVDTLVEDPESLAGQLVHSFSDVISNKKSSMVPAGFCLKLWH